MQDLGTLLGDCASQCGSPSIRFDARHALQVDDRRTTNPHEPRGIERGFQARDGLLALARSYLEVEQVRFGARLQVKEEVDAACEGCAVPALILQPLVENAVKHGIAGLVEGGTIRLGVRRAAEGVAIIIENDVDAETSSGKKAGATSLGMGQAHVRQRLQVRYGVSASFGANQEDGVYRVVLRFPCESPMAG